jgi:hypothetical protein
MKAEKAIYTRAIPESVEFTETYFYEQEISLNSSSSKEKQKPCGEIKVVVPYDGHHNLKRQAIEDAKKQIKNNKSNNRIDSLIGYLAISNYNETDIDAFLDNNQRYDSIPLKIPITTELISNLESINEDRNVCIIEQKYHPNSPKIEIAKLDIKVLDDDIDFRDILSTENTEKISDKIEEKVSGFSGKNNWFKNQLIIQINIQLAFSEEYNLEQIPKINKISIHWPTITCLNNIKCLVNFENSSKNIKYNPLNSSLEWKNKENNNILRSQDINNGIYYEYNPILFLISHPGELYQQDSLEGEIEIEIPDTLLSGLKTRFYQFDSQKAGSLSDNHIKKSTKIISNFELILDDVFHKRPRTISQEIKFDKIFLDDECIKTVESTLETQGFEYSSSPSIHIRSDNDKKELKYLISAWRSEGIENMSLWIVAKGKQLQTIRTTKQKGMEIQSKDESGELTMYLLGRFVGNNHLLLRRINAIHKELRKQFEKQQREK